MSLRSVFLSPLNGGSTRYELLLIIFFYHDLLKHIHTANVKFVNLIYMSLYREEVNEYIYF